MERLTERTHGSIADELVEEMGNPIDSVFVKKVDYATCEGVCRQQKNCNDCPLYEVMRKLADYEDAEEQGLLLRLPCKVDEEVYIIRKCSCWNDYQYTANNRLKCKGKTNIPSGAKKKTTCAYIAKAKFELKHIAEIGKTVFLTREEAEQALAEMQKGGAE